MIISKQLITLNTHSLYIFVLNKLHQVFKSSLNFKYEKGTALGKYYSPEAWL